MSLLLAGNGNMLERIMSPFQLYKTPELPELRKLAQEALSKRFFNHYRGYFKGMCAEHERNGAPRAKTLLYTYRVALTGVHLLKTGRLEADLNVTAPAYGFPDVLDLIAIKREQGEKSALTADQDQAFKQHWPDLEQLLDEATANSPLLEQSPNRQEVSQWLRSKRLSSIM